MQLLLDTHALLWWMGDMPQLGATARRHIMQPDNRAIVSAVSVWEIEIKRALGKLKAPGDIKAAIDASQFETMPITIDHSIAAARLPPHHQDPFDRMLIAQAKEENLTIVTKDQVFPAYNVPILEAGQ